MIVTVLLTALGVLAVAFTTVLIQTAWRRNELRPTLESLGLGAVTNFFDTLGIGSFATTTAWIKLRKLVPDSFIPGTLNVGHALPTVAQAYIFIQLVSVDPKLLAACIAASVAGAIVGAPIVVRLPVRVVQGVVGIALLIAAALYALSNLAMMPAGGEALALTAAPFAIAVVGHFVMGALMTFGIGLYAPSLILLSLLGLNPIAAFPIMMGACAFLMPVCGMRFVRAEHQRASCHRARARRHTAGAGRRFPGEIAVARGFALGRRGRRAVRGRAAAALGDEAVGATII